MKVSDMATKRQRSSGSWEYIVKCKALLSKPISLTFKNEVEGDKYVAKLEANLRAGIVPAEYKQTGAGLVLISDAIKQYRTDVAVPDSDWHLLKVISHQIGSERVSTFDYDRVASWVTEMKREQNLKPSTIRHYVGALARCMDWVVNRKQLPVNPLRLLRKRYSTYNETDIQVVLAKDMTAQVDDSRDRRLLAAEETKIRWIMGGAKLDGRERPLALKWQGALEAFFDIGLGSLMRMREMYTLTLDQVDISKRTFFLEKTKNGSKRQVPMSTAVIAALERYMEQVRDGQRGMEAFSFDGGNLFPWWNGDISPAELKKVTCRLSQQFSRIFEAADCPDFRFHDIRHEAASRLYERTNLTDVEIMKIGGWSSINMLGRYTNLRASDLAERMG